MVSDALDGAADRYLCGGSSRGAERSLARMGLHVGVLDHRALPASPALLLRTTPLLRRIAKQSRGARWSASVPVRGICRPRHGPPVRPATWQTSEIRATTTAAP